MAGVKSGLMVRNIGNQKVAIEDQAIATGKRFWVHSGTGTNGTAFGDNPDRPLATVDYANNLCTASKGDIIYVMPGHAENLSGATSLVMDTIGVQVIGIGNGRLKPQFTITAAAGTWNVTAANCLIKNVDIISNFLNVVASMTVGTAADGLTLDGVRFYDTSVILGSLKQIDIAATVSDITIQNCKFYGIALTAPATECIDTAGAYSHLVIENCYFKGEYSGNVIDLATTASVDILLKDIIMINMSETGGGIDIHASTTGAAHNVMAYLEDQTGNEPAITGAAILMTDRVRQTNVVTASPYLCIAADS